MSTVIKSVFFALTFKLIFRILSSRVSMKVHLMETHHEVYQDDHEWLDLLVDDDQNKLHFQVRLKNFRKNYNWLL